VETVCFKSGICHRYNAVKPHSSLDYLTPNEFSAKLKAVYDRPGSLSPAIIGPKNRQIASSTRTSAKPRATTLQAQQFNNPLLRRSADVATGPRALVDAGTHQRLAAWDRIRGTARNREQTQRDDDVAGVTAPAARCANPAVALAPVSTP